MTPTNNKLTLQNKEIESIPHRCPVCGGNGFVPNGFYIQIMGSWSTNSTTPETCRSCNGTGILWSNLSVHNIQKGESNE